MREREREPAGAHDLILTAMYISSITDLMRQFALGPRRSLFAFTQSSSPRTLASTFGVRYTQHLPETAVTTAAHAIFGVPLNLLSVMAEVGNLAVEEAELDIVTFQSRARELEQEVREWKGVEVTSDMLADSARMLQQTATREMTRQYVSCTQRRDSTLLMRLRMIQCYPYTHLPDTVPLRSHAAAHTQIARADYLARIESTLRGRHSC